MGPPAIITCALVGAELSREQTPYLPLTPEEIAQSALEAYEAGAAMVHVHVRDAEGKPTCRAQVFQETLAKIRQRCPVIIQVSTGGAIGDSEADRLRPLEAGPDMASLSTGSVNFGDEVFLNARPFVLRLARSMAKRNIKPEIEVFDVAMLENALGLVAQGELKEPLHVDFVLGVPGGLGATRSNLEFLLSKLPHAYTWSVAAMGRHQFPMAGVALELGGHVRVGLEDNIYLSKGVLAKGNGDLVAHGARLVQEAGREVASVAQARELLGLENQA